MSVWYEYKTKIDTRDVDGRSRCRPSALLGYLQEAATLAAEDRGLAGRCFWSSTGPSGCWPGCGTGWTARCAGGMS